MFTDIHVRITDDTITVTAGDAILIVHSWSFLFSLMQQANCYTTFDGRSIRLFIHAGA